MGQREIGVVGAVLDTVVRKDLLEEIIFELKLNRVEERPW